MQKTIKQFPQGTITLPPSKSVAHRAVICAGLADGQSVLRNITRSNDIDATVACMRALGAVCDADGDVMRITGGLTAANRPLDCGESGSTLRFLIPIAVLLDSEISLTGHGRLMQRPLTPFLNALGKGGAEILQDGQILRVKGPIKSGRYELPGDISSQYVSGLLFALPLLGGDSEIVLTSPLESASYVDLTIDAMAQFGVAVEHTEYSRFTVRGGQRYTAANMAIEADYSQAAFFLIASMLGCECSCAGLEKASKQGDRRILDILQNSGGEVVTHVDGSISIKAERLIAQTVDVSDIPDLVPPLAALFALCDGESRIINAGRLRHKESDRLSAVASELNALGAGIIEESDALIIRGRKRLRGGIVNSHNDHRIAMMAAVAAIGCDGAVTVAGSECVAKSYPRFLQDFEKKERFSSVCRCGIDPQSC